MKHDARGANWHMKIADAIEAASDGDVVFVDSDAAAALGEGARQRMEPNKRLTFEVDPLLSCFREVEA